ncbi:hypothetical protein TNCV_3710401 [Trichonephila clavipes]|nr:hypothetical protein TNCV_3710401 [Trichonephila clavipes]
MNRLQLKIWHPVHRFGLPVGLLVFVLLEVILACLHPPPRSPTREEECRTTDNCQARRLPEVHPEYSAIASMIQRVNPPSLSAALTLQQCLSGDTEEKYHQTIDRLIPTSRLQRSVGQRKRKSNPGTLFSFLGDSAHGKHAV